MIQHEMGQESSTGQSIFRVFGAMSSWDLGCWHPLASMAQGQWSWVRFAPRPLASPPPDTGCPSHSAQEQTGPSLQSPLSVFTSALGPASLPQRGWIPMAQTPPTQPPPSCHVQRQAQMLPAPESAQSRPLARVLPDRAGFPPAPRANHPGDVPASMPIRYHYPQAPVAMRGRAVKKHRS